MVMKKFLRFLLHLYDKKDLLRIQMLDRETSPNCFQKYIAIKKVPGQFVAVERRYPGRYQDFPVDIIFVPDVGKPICAANAIPIEDICDGYSE
jgi:hypothetical protein